MLKKALKITGILLAALTILFGAAFFYLYFNKAKVIQIFTNEVNKNLEARIDVADIDLSLRKFPLAAIAMKRTVCYEPTKTAVDTLFAFEHIFFQFSVWDLLRGRYDLQKITFENGKVRVRTLAGGQPNYVIWKTTTPAEPTLQLELREVAFNNTQFRYETTDWQLQKSIEKLTLKGSFDEQRSQLKMLSSGTLVAVNTNQTRWIQQALPFQISVALENRPEGLSIQAGELKLPGVQFNCDGFWGNDRHNIKGKAQKIQLAQIRKWLPDNWTSKLNFWEIDGAASLEFVFAEQPKSPQQITIDFRLSDGLLRAPDWAAPMKNVQFEGKYFSNGTTDKLQFTEATANFNGLELSGQLVAIPLSKPSVSGVLSMAGPVKALRDFFPKEMQPLEMDGFVNLQVNFSKGPVFLAQLQEAPLANMQFSGEVALQDGNILLPEWGVDWQKLHLLAAFKGADVLLKNLAFEAGSTDITLSGTAQNALAWAQPNDKPVVLDLQLASQKFDFADVAKIAVPPAEKNKTATTPTATTTQLQWKITASAKNFVFDGLTGKQLTGIVNSTTAGFSGHDIRFKALDGAAATAFEWRETPQGYHLSNETQLQQTNIKALFTAFENFGQEVLTDQHLEGVGNADFQWSMAFNQNLAPIVSTLRAESKLKITNGRLKNFPPMLELSKFADVQELRDVRFATLENNISIANEQIVIPEMEINSNLLGLSVMGTHAFSGAIDYSIKIRQGDIVAAKRRGRDLDNWITETGNANEAFLWVRMFGTTDAPKFGLNKEKNREGLKEGWKSQGEALRDKTKQEPLKQQTKGYQFEWED